MGDRVGRVGRVGRVAGGGRLRAPSGLVVTGLALVLVAAACSAKSSSPRQPTGGTGTGSAGVSSSAGAGAPRGPGSSATSNGSSTGGGAGGGGGGAPSGATGGGSGPASGAGPVRGAVTSAGPLGRGITATTISLGFVYPKNTNTGTAQVPTADEHTIMQTVIAWYNNHGGIAGRRIVPVYYANDETSSQTYAQREQERCAVFTEDNHVFGVYPNYTTTENEAACLAKTGTLLLVDSDAAPNGGIFDDVSLKNYPNLYELVQPSANRLFTAFIDQLDAAKFFDKGAKIGVVYTDDPADQRAVKAALLPALAAHGLKATEVASVRSPYNINDLAPTESQIQSAELKFRTENITHVLIPTGLGTIISGDFMKSAQSQGYTPRYGLESGSLGIEKEPFSGTDITSQLHNALYVGWDPYGDVHDLGSTSAAVACNAILKAAGIPPDPRAMSVCDVLSTVKAGLERGPGLNAAGFGAGLLKTGQMAMTRTWVTDWQTGRRDGAGLLRIAHYDFACHQSGSSYCWRYAGPQIPF
ncbi:MAG: ABC transporter substrate-binding protein [Acidimicrobiales bacterium]